MGVGYHAQLLLSAYGAGQYGMSFDNGYIHIVFYETVSRGLCGENQIVKEFFMLFLKRVCCFGLRQYAELGWKSKTRPYGKK
jgi:hypothetical protein